MAYFIQTQVNRELKKFGLTSEQYNVLRILKGKHPQSMCVKNIAGRVIKRSSNIPRIVDRLIAKKLVTRCVSEKDKRETIISLTPQGIRLLEKANKMMEQLDKQITHLSGKELNQLNS
jgi:DNA-binding MarR family transcriptional regulator